MTNSGDAAEQVVRLSLEGFEVAARLTGSAAKNIAILLASVLKQEATQANKTRGKARLTNMIKSGKELKVFSIPNKDLKKFTEQAKRYGVLYCVLRDKNTRGDNVPIDIIARAEDASKIQRIVERFELGKVDKAAIVTESQKAVEKREAVEKDKPTKSKNEIITEEAVRKPLQKEENAQSNPTTAKTDKNPPSRQNSEPEDMQTDKGIAVDRQKKPYATGITQNVDDLLQSHTARTMLANSEFIIMLNQASTDRLELAKLLNISDLQLSYITNVDAGHGLIKVGSSLVPFANKFPKNTKLYRLMTTKPGEGL